MLFADKMKPEDVGLRADQEFFTARDDDEGIPLIKNTTLYECDNFTVSSRQCTKLTEFKIYHDMFFWYQNGSCLKQIF
jgi:hypothetical protein